MEDNINQVVDATMSDEDLELDLDLSDTEDVEALKLKLAEKDKTLKQILARAKKAEALAKANSSKPITNPEPIRGIDDETLDLRLDGYTRDEVEFIARNGGRKALEDKTSYVAIALNTKREQQKAEAAASQTQDTSGMSELERKYTPDMLANMSVEELEKVLPRA
jgi:hypothetical protein